VSPLAHIGDRADPSPARHPDTPRGLGVGPQGPSVELGANAYAGHMLVAISISPSGGPQDDQETGGVSASVAEAVRVIRESGLPNETNAMFTNLEGSWDDVMAVVKKAVFAVAETSPRVGLVLKADLRAGHDTGQLTAKVERLEEHLGPTDQ
jgi:uncharacterized protein YqgV (UPF0045/DUF77 family)